MLSRFPALPSLKHEVKYEILLRDAKAPISDTARLYKLHRHSLSRAGEIFCQTIATKISAD
jgi:ActR/RegA family two-component response regulator